MKPPSVVVAGDFAWSFYEPDFCAGLRVAGAEVIEFRSLNYLGGPLLRRVQQRWAAGPGVTRANRELERLCFQKRPSILLAWRAPWLTAATIRACQWMGAKVVLYNNDDPFGPDRGLRIWRKFRGLIPLADACFVYRQVNLEDFRLGGARHVRLLRSWFNPELHRAIELDGATRSRWESDVVFVGHAEADGRLEALQKVAASGLRLRIFGAGWLGLEGRLSQPGSIEPALGEEYVRAIAAARVALVFLSTRNRDDYTRRCFEIPAIGTAMLAPRTSTLVSMFKEGEEALFFSSTDELVAQAQRLCGEEAFRRQVAAGGHARVLRDGHDVISRARGFLADLRELFPGLAWS